MIYSMTGFGRATAEQNGLEIVAEIKSVNNRFLDCGVRLPRKWAALEERIKPLLQSRGISRGKVDVSVQVTEKTNPEATVEPDEVFLASYLAALRKMRDDYGLADDITVMSVAKNPAVFRENAATVDLEEVWALLCPVLSAAVEAHLAARAREGGALVADLAEKRETVCTLVDEIESLSAGTVENYRKKLAERVREALADNRVTPDEGRLLTEVALFADRVAIDEELVRLRTHLDSMREMLAGEGPVGRKLDFLLQEINREANTIGSKCNDAEVAGRVVALKYELEKMREQIQNLE